MAAGLHAREILIAPVVSEKSYSLIEANKYSFKVHSDAHRTQIAQAVEELFASGGVTPMDEAIAMIDAIGAEEVRWVFARMLANPPALAITGKGATAKTARRLAAMLTG